jgi:hypothetical protein
MKTILSLFAVTLLCTILSTVVAFRSHYEVARLRKLLDISPNGGLTIPRLVVKDDDGNSSVIQPGCARFFSPNNGKPGNPSVLVTAMGKPYVSIIDVTGKERVVLGVAHTQETQSGNKTITGEGTITFFDSEGVMTVQLP